MIKIIEESLLQGDPRPDWSDNSTQSDLRELWVMRFKEFLQLNSNIRAPAAGDNPETLTGPLSQPLSQTPLDTAWELRKNIMTKLLLHQYDEWRNVVNQVVLTRDDNTMATDGSIKYYGCSIDNHLHTSAASAMREGFPTKFRVKLVISQFTKTQLNYIELFLKVWVHNWLVATWTQSLESMYGFATSILPTLPLPTDDIPPQLNPPGFKKCFTAFTRNEDYELFFMDKTINAWTNSSSDDNKNNDDDNNNNNNNNDDDNDNKDDNEDHNSNDEDEDEGDDVDEGKKEEEEEEEEAPRHPTRRWGTT